MVVPCEIVVLIRGEREGETICGLRTTSRRLYADYVALSSQRGLMVMLMGRLADIGVKEIYLLPRKALKNGWSNLLSSLSQQRTKPAAILGALSLE